MRQHLAQLWANVRDSPKTSAAAIAGIIASIVAAIKNPAVLSTEAWWVAFLGCVGLLFAPDMSRGVTVNHNSVTFTKEDLRRLEELTKERK
jgi:hypothetical protein